MRVKLFRYLVAAAFLLSVPPVSICSAHYSWGRHMHHPSYSWFDYASHYAFLYLMISVLAFSLLGNLSERHLLYIVALLAYGAFFVFPGLHMALAMVGVSIFVGMDVYSSRVSPTPEEK